MTLAKSGRMVDVLALPDDPCGNQEQAMAIMVMIDGVRYMPAPAHEQPGNEVGDERRARMAAALSVRFNSDAGDGLTVRQYLCRLLADVWRDGECFDGKRPFGNSGWQSEVITALVDAGFIAGGDKRSDKANAMAYVVDLIVLMATEPDGTR